MDAIKTFPKFTIFFICLMIVELLSLTVMPEFHIVSKAMIMAGIIGFYVVAEQPQNNIFLLALIFALLGDVFLLFKGNDFFTIGLLCFLIMQICYTLTFKEKKRIPKPAAYLLPLVFVLIGLGFLVSFWEDFGVLSTYVAIYTIAIVAMASFAYLRHPKLRGYWILLVGVILFIISDGILAVELFVEKNESSSIAVMIPYMIAQYCIVTGHVLGTRKRILATPKVNSSFARHKYTK